MGAFSNVLANAAMLEKDGGLRAALTRAAKGLSETELRQEASSYARTATLEELDATLFAVAGKAGEFFGVVNDAKIDRVCGGKPNIWAGRVPC